MTKPPIKWTRKKVEALQEWEFPGGYSAHKTRGNCTFNAEKAMKAVNFGPTFFKHVKGEKGGQPIYPEPWQAACYANVFGWERPDGLRRYRTVYEEMGRGNGKSLKCVVVAGILLYIDDEPGADIYSAAGTRDQAREVFGPFKHNVLDNPMLAAISQCYQNSVVRIDERTGLPCGNVKVITADADVQHGGNPHGIIFDEMHVQPTRDLWDVLQTGKIKRRQPLAWAITTAGFDRHSICYEVRKYAEQVRDGVINDNSFLPIIYAASSDDDWTDPKTWCLSSDTKLYVKNGMGESVVAMQTVAKNWRHGMLVWDGRNWVKIIKCEKAAESDRKVRLRLRSGQRISCTEYHEWPTTRGKVRAGELKAGDVLLRTVLPDSPDHPSGITPAIGRFIGLYLAEGSLSGGTIQLSGHAKENIERLAWVQTLAESFGGTAVAHTYRNRGTVNVESKVLRAFLEQYAGGTNAHTKYIRPAMWRCNNLTLRALAEGYLEGDGGYDKLNDRWRLGFCRNDRLADSLRTLAARLNVGIKLNAAFANCAQHGSFAKRRYAVYRGEWRWNRSTYPNSKDECEVVAIESSSARLFWHIGVDNDDGLYALASGVLSHNSKANPNLGVSIRLEDIAAECEKAKASPGYENTFKRLHLCIWTETDVRWLSLETWRKGNEELPDLDGEPCWCGLDLSTTTDLSAFAMAFPRSAGGYYLLVKLWAPQERARQRAKRDGVPYLEWAQQEFLKLTPGDVVDYDVIRADINALNQRYSIQEIAIDRWNAAQIATQLLGDGFTVNMFGQGYASMSPAAKEFEKLVIQGALQHGGNPILEWMAANVAIEQDAAGNIKPSKQKSTERIDGIVAAVMAVGRASTAQPQQDWWNPSDGVLL